MAGLLFRPDAFRKRTYSGRLRPLEGTQAALSVTLVVVYLVYERGEYLTKPTVPSLM